MTPLSRAAWAWAIGAWALGSSACATAAGRASAAGEAALEPCPAEVAAPHVLPGAKPEHREVGFWIDRLPAPDAEILSPAEIRAFSEQAEGMWRRDDFGFRRNILANAVDPAPVLAQLEKDVDAVRQIAAGGARVLLDGSPLTDALFDEMKQVVAAGQPAGELRVAYQLVPLRSLPTYRGFYEKAGDQDFDLMHASTLRPGELVRVISTHPAGWRLVRSEYAYGWTKGAGLSAPLPERAAVEYRGAERFVVVTSDRAPVWTSPRRSEQLVSAYIGARLPLRATSDDPAALVAVLAPSPTGLREGWMAAADVHVGLLPLTRRNVFRQAFRQLDDTFGWGGMEGDRDCSRFLMDLFALFGLELPRNSKFQAQTGSWQVDLEGVPVQRKIAEIDRAAKQGIVLLYMPGHIMLLLGRDEAERYAIHQFSGYRVPCPGGGDIKMVVSRTSVTDLRLGEGSGRRSFIERLTKLVVFGRPASR